MKSELTESQPQYLLEANFYNQCQFFGVLTSKRARFFDLLTSEHRGLRDATSGQISFSLRMFRGFEAVF